MMENLLDKDKIKASDLEINIVHGIYKCSGGAEHIISFNDGKENLGSASLHISKDFDGKEYFNSIIEKALEELRILGYRTEHSEQDRYKITAKRV
jgi:hypothetical protein